MYFCYIDESGTPDIPGNTSHYILAGVSLPIAYWKKCDKGIIKIKKKYNLKDAEIHTGWIARAYNEQNKIDNFDQLDYHQRRYEVEKLRKAEILKLQKSKNSILKQVKKNYKKTEQYIHLSYSERINFLHEIADYIGNESYIRIFAECVDKIHFDPTRSIRTVDEQCLEQLVSRFERYISNISTEDKFLYGALIHDNNETEAAKHTELMKQFHIKGTLFTDIKHIIETPLFVNSELTSMVQIADLCAFALRRYFENSEVDLLNRIAPRFDRYKKHEIVGIRHFSDPDCSCMFCQKKHINSTQNNSLQD